MMLNPCDFCDTNLADPVKLIGVVSDEATEKVVEEFSVTVFVCYTCRIVGRVLNELQGGSE